MRNSFEVVYPPKDDNVNHLAVPNAHTRTYEYVSYQDALKNLELPSANHLNEKKFLDKNDPGTFYFEDVFAEALEPFLSRACVKYMRFRGRKDKSFAAWLILKDDVEEPLKINTSFLEEAVVPKVTAVTLVNSNDVRLLRVSLKRDRSRLYEIVNGSCKIQFAWKVGEKRCHFTAVLSSDGGVSVAEKECNLEDLAEKVDVFVRFGEVSNPDLTLKDIFDKCDATD